MRMDADRQDDTDVDSRRRALVLRGAVLCVLAGGALAAWWVWGEHLTLEGLARQERALRECRRQQPVLVYGAALGLMVAVTGLSIPAATVLTLGYAWLFGFGRAVLLVSFGSTAGATLAFLLSRFLFHDAVRRRFGDRLERCDRALRRNGAGYLLLLRLTPVVPFFIVNLVMGLTPLRARTFWWASQLGMLPASCVWAWAGASFPSLSQLAAAYSQRGPWALVSLPALAALALIGLIPLLVRLVVPRWFPAAAESGA